MLWFHFQNSKMRFSKLKSQSGDAVEHDVNISWVSFHLSGGQSLGTVISTDPNYNLERSQEANSRPRLCDVFIRRHLGALIPGPYSLRFVGTPWVTWFPNWPQSNWVRELGEVLPGLQPDGCASARRELQERMVPELLSTGVSSFIHLGLFWSTSECPQSWSWVVEESLQLWLVN